MVLHSIRYDESSKLVYGSAGSKNGYNIEAWVSFHPVKLTFPLSKSIFEQWDKNTPVLEAKQQKLLGYPTKLAARIHDTCMEQKRDL